MASMLIELLLAAKGLISCLNHIQGAAVSFFQLRILINMLKKLLNISFIEK